ncbi:DUF3800 domain-containing protein [Bradyrhizobium guangxiense]
MTCRLYIDEVGNDDVRSPAERFLSITGIITKKRGHDYVIVPAIEGIKAKFFNHDPANNLVVLHRREIVRKEAPFSALQDPTVNALWEGDILDLIERMPYIAHTIIIDKEETR